MGEVAEMMLEGVLCECCGSAFDDVDYDDYEEPGHPMYCSVECAKDRGIPKKDWPYSIVGYKQ